ncbi:urease accessory protein UreF [Sphaerisporangium melleum]|uniref:Urease accessory protein UreF n=1 Tax=Sphaerisporangium melleum TaxID=321316 RepID=A0A917VSP6_9ACTN|nr:urease accessory UreF family protein [Sphaerisporangium melleum]GGL10721.1 urease accessory protein UreF [Sphaerisporangium melleum]GII69113.1 urease accessory protein UreF [Sphaerisporangium melleum]
MDAALLLLADSRLPAGGHAHSGGAEQAVRAGAITGTEDLARFLRGRLATTGLVTAALSAAACHLAVLLGSHGEDGGRPWTEPSAAAAAESETDARAAWRELDAEADARTASPAQRYAARTQGRLLLRSGRRIWPSPVLDTLAQAVPDGVHHPIALGAVAAAAGCSRHDAAMAAAYTSITGPATAAVRLLGLDPVVVHRVLAGLVPDLSGVARTATAAASGTVEAGVAARGTAAEAVLRIAWEELPAHAAPALDLLAEQHLRTEVRLFVS